MERYLCIHGHFYQPPRENPWLEAVEVQDTAYPYHDWNKRIAAECYATNAASRILNGDGRIVKIVNNYARISFNFGPTLLMWMAENDPHTYEAVLAADRESVETFEGRGSAMAQAYNHMIMPLANRRDKHTQALWGIRDFEHRFGRSPEGMWLPETAVDLETLEVLADLGIRFTVLAPHQAGRARGPRERAWRDVSGQLIDPTRAYRVILPSGKSMALFFYDGPTSRAVAFEGLLTSGERFVDRLMGAFPEREGPRLVHIATDGETYGHHHRNGDMALAYALASIEQDPSVQLINYAAFLERYPPEHEVEIIENTSWSCPHGVERWCSDCGCNSGARPNENQAWRRPLRDALDWLRDTVAPAFERLAGELLDDPWAARDDYIDIILDRGDHVVDGFMGRHARRELTDDEQIRVLKLMELQRHAMLMYTSCGWFFNELSGMETVQIIQYAGRVVQLARELFGDAIEPRFLELLSTAKSNLPEHRDGRAIYEKWVKPAQVTLAQVGAHYAFSSLFESLPDETRVYGYRVERHDHRTSEAGVMRLAVGRARVTSVITTEWADLSYGVLHFGDHNMSGGVREFKGEAAFEQMAQEVMGAFERADLTEALRLLDAHFIELTYSLRSLFRDQQRAILNQILESTLAGAEATYRQVYEHHVALMRFLTDLGTPLPRAFRAAAEIVVNANLLRALEDVPDPDYVRAQLEAVQRLHVEIDGAGLAFALGCTIERLIGQLRDDPADDELLRRADATVGLAHDMPFKVDLWEAQNVYYDMALHVFPILARAAELGESDAEEWTRLFTVLGEKLSVRID